MFQHAEAYRYAQILRAQIEKSIFGQESLVHEALCALLAGGHLLITGAPGLAKTTLVRAIGKATGLQCGRLQFTPDLLPSDITGTDVLNMDAESGRRRFEFNKGPVFVNLLLADEINRASPRTQSALLEAMQERTVTVGNTQHLLSNPFMVFATQNPFESEGTFPLPEAQLDRFVLHSIVDYPNSDAERRVYKELLAPNPTNDASPSTAESGLLDLSVHGTQVISGLIQYTKSVHLEDGLVDACSDLIRMTRPSDSSCPDALKRAISFGAGTRAGLAILSTAKASALLDGRDRVAWSDIRRVVKPALRHRIRLTVQALREQWTEDRVIDAIADRIEAQYTSLVQVALS